MIPDVRIRFQFNGDARELVFVEVPLAAWSDLRRSVELTPRKLMEGLEDRSDLDSMSALIWLERVATGHDLGRFVPFRDSLSPQDDLALAGLKVGPKVLFGEFGGDQDGPPTSGTE